MIPSIAKTAWLLVFCLSVAQAQEVEQTLEKPINEVKIYLQGAEIVHHTPVTLVAGKNKLIFSNLSPKIYDKTIQASLSNDVRLLSITSKINFLKRREDSPQIRSLRDSVRIIRDQIEALESEREAYQQEKALLLSNQQIRNGETSTNWTGDLEKAADFFRQRMLSINKKLLQIERQWTEVNRRLFDFKLQLHELNAGQQPTSEIYLVVETPQAKTIDLSLRYLVADAGWMPLYDLYAGEVGEKIELRYRGMAYNNTGVDWKEVKLSLSTADPMQSAVQPQLAIWDINTGGLRYNQEFSQMQVQQQQVSYQLNPFQAPESYTKKTITYTEQYTSIDMTFVRQLLGGDYRDKVDYETDLYRRYQSEKQPKGGDVQFTTIELPEMNAVFHIDRPYTIPSDKKPYSIDISTNKLEAQYQYLAVPKIDKDAFLMAAVMGWEELDLVSGPVNIYNRERYLGQSFLDIRNISDTLAVSLGRDPSVVVSRVQVAGSNKKQFLGAQQKMSIAYNITVKNNRAKGIVIEIQDQVPISTDKDVVVTVDERSNANYLADIGLLSWKFALDPSQEKTLAFGFSVKYPKERNLNVSLRYSRSRKMGCPTF